MSNQYIYSVDEALELINEGKVERITNTSGGGMSYSYGGGSFSQGATVSSISATSSTKLNKYWVTKGMLKRHMSNGDIDYRKVNGKYYFSALGIKNLRKLYDNMMAEENYSNGKKVMIYLLIGIVVIVLFVLFGKYVLHLGDMTFLSLP